jgi:hypothetical protein
MKEQILRVTFYRTRSHGLGLPGGLPARHDYFLHCDVDELCEWQGKPMRRPEEGDLFLAYCDALIAAQNAVIAAESFGIGLCYIGDILFLLTVSLIFC